MYVRQTDCQTTPLLYMYTLSLCVSLSLFLALSEPILISNGKRQSLRVQINVRQKLGTEILVGQALFHRLQLPTVARLHIPRIREAGV